MTGASAFTLAALSLSAKKGDWYPALGFCCANAVNPTNVAMMPAQIFFTLLYFLMLSSLAIVESDCAIDSLPYSFSPVPY